MPKGNVTHKSGIVTGKAMLGINDRTKVILLETIIPLHAQTYCGRCSLEYLLQRHIHSCYKRNFYQLSRKVVGRVHKVKII